jgi:SlyX protein
MDRLTEIEERLAHLAGSVEDLSDVVARQEREIGTLTRRLTLLMEREAERQAETQAPLADAHPDRPPPHW